MKYLRFPHMLVKCECLMKWLCNDLKVGYAATRTNTFSSHPLSLKNCTTLLQQTCLASSCKQHPYPILCFKPQITHSYSPGGDAALEDQLPLPAIKDVKVGDALLHISATTYPHCGLMWVWGTTNGLWFRIIVNVLQTFYASTQFCQRLIWFGWMFVSRRDTYERSINLLLQVALLALCYLRPFILGYFCSLVSLA
jgi:hypothetical protein